MTNLFRKAAICTDIHWGLKSNSLVHNKDCEAFIDWFIENKCGHHGPSHPERFEYVVVDEYFPDCITQNLEKYQHMIVPDAAFHVTDLYRE